MNRDLPFNLLDKKLENDSVNKIFLCCKIIEFLIASIYIMQMHFMHRKILYEHYALLQPKRHVFFQT